MATVLYTNIQATSGIIVSALSHSALRIILTVVGDPLQRLDKLDPRFDSQLSTTKISKITELVSLRNHNVKDDITNHTDLTAALLKQLKGLKTIADDEVQIGIFIASESL